VGASCQAAAAGRIPWIIDNRQLGGTDARMYSSEANFFRKLNSADLVRSYIVYRRCGVSHVCSKHFSSIDNFSVYNNTAEKGFEPARKLAPWTTRLTWSDPLSAPNLAILVVVLNLAYTNRRYWRYSRDLLVDLQLCIHSTAVLPDSTRYALSSHPGRARMRCLARGAVHSLTASSSPRTT
jgi:hypothetical protein